jgi:flagellar M-ring protein FliF
MWSDLRNRLTAVWGAQTLQTRILAGMGIAVVALALAALAFLYVGRQPSYVTLFSNLAPDDAAAVTTRLKDDKVPYRLSADGKTVYVPDSAVSDERVQIAGSGAIKGGGTGYELFDRTNFGMTEFQEKLDKTRAIEGELQRTIDGLDPVQTSRVAIATPDESLYSSSQQPTTASIAIKTKPGQSLTAQQVKGITMLVASAVEGLKPENVTMVDQNGQILLPGSGTGTSGDGTAADAFRLTQEQLLAKQRYESTVQQSIQSMLDDTLGPKHAVARVSTKMDFDATSTESKIYSPQGTVLSQQTERESNVGNAPRQQPATGVPGTTSNIGTYQAVQAPAINNRYNHSKNTVNYNISEQNVKHIDAPGKVLQTSVAVLVNSAVPPASAPTGGAVAVAATPYVLTPANVAQIRNVVIAAADLNLAQGDQVSVEAIPFNPGAATQGTPSAVTTTVLGIPVWLLAVLGIGILGGLGFLATRSRRSRFAPATELPAFDTSLAEELPPFEEHPILEGAPGMAAPIRSAADLTREQMIEYVTTVAQENPDSIAKLVKLWLAE